THLAALRDGHKLVEEARTVTGFVLTGNGPILFCEKRTRKDGKQTVLRVVRKGKHMLVSTRKGARTTERVTPFPSENLAGSRRFEAWLARAGKGEKFVRWSTDWDHDKPDVRETCTFVGKKAVLRGGKQVPLYAVGVVMPDMRLSVEMFADGVALQASLSV